ncbi:hypothetical protein Pan44_26630 [Caulifigura coniformis]|uniref:Uncharacterized protein n=1 Tax=Caulifigura coniformis TaxID=2527983 RepID=A0A517SEU2_9PLAN|nr:hypothetical protein Pan44_26630 [Caulifigura coniformis]
MNMRACNHRNARLPFKVHGVFRCYCEHPEIATSGEPKRIPVSQCEGCLFATEQMSEEMRRRLAGEPCQHRSAGPVRSVDCVPCQGTRQIDVYACDKHGACVASRKDRDGLPTSISPAPCVCRTCPDWTTTVQTALT